MVKMSRKWLIKLDCALCLIKLYNLLLNVLFCFKILQSNLFSLGLFAFFTFSFKLINFKYISIWKQLVLFWQKISYCFTKNCLQIAMDRKFMDFWTGLNKKKIKNRNNIWKHRRHFCLYWLFPDSGILCPVLKGLSKTKVSHSYCDYIGVS